MKTNSLSIRKRNTLLLNSRGNSLLIPLLGAGLAIAIIAVAAPVYRLIAPISMRGVQQASSVDPAATEHSGSSPSPHSSKGNTESSNAFAVRSDKQTRFIGNVPITIRYTGFEPSEIRRPAGPVFLLVQNRSGYHEVALRLDRETGGRLYDVRVPRSKLDWQQVVDLTPGRYILTDAYHPDWSCTITVTPK